MDQSQKNPQDKAVKGSVQKSPEKYNKDTTSLSHRYPTLKAYLEADTRKFEGMRQCSKPSMPVHHDVNNQESVTSTTSDGKRKREDDDNKSRKK